MSEVSTESILPVVYDELRRIADARLRRESQQFTLQPTALVHEAWLRLSGDHGIIWENRAHFLAAAAQAMRRILVDRARARASAKRLPPDPVAGDDLLSCGRGEHVLMIHDCLIRLERSDPELARIVLLKFYAGLGSREISAATGLSVRSVERQWTLARARLFQMITEDLRPAAAER